MALSQALAPYYLADKSALARFAVPLIEARLAPLLDAGIVATCAIVDLEVLYSARNVTEYEAILEERSGLPQAPVTPDVLSTAIDLQHALARRGHHRVAIPDLIISAAAEHAGLVVLHYDRDFEAIAEVGGAVQQWVALPGSL